MSDSYVTPVVYISNKKLRGSGVILPLSEQWSDGYKADIKPIAGTYKLSHPIYFSYKGGEVKPLNITTKLVCGLKAEGSPYNAEALRTEVEQLYSFAVPPTAFDGPDGGVSGLKLYTSKVRIGNWDNWWFERFGFVTDVNVTWGDVFDKKGFPMWAEISFVFTAHFGGGWSSTGDMGVWADLPHGHFKFSTSGGK